MTEEENLVRLRKLFENLSKQMRKTAEICWESCPSYRFSNYSMSGIRDAALLYTEELSKENEKPNNSKKKPHEMVIELNRIASTARDLERRLKRISRQSLDLIVNSTLNDPPIVPSQRTDEQRFLKHSNLHAWFEMPPDHSCEERLVIEGLPWMVKDGTRHLELEALANSLDWISKEAEAQKEPPSGARNKISGQNNPLLGLLFNVGSIVTTQGCPISHIIPIAGKVHEWATREPVGGDWGIRPFERVRPHIKGMDELEDEFCPPPPY